MLKIFYSILPYNASGFNYVGVDKYYGYAVKNHRLSE